jgi:hypothetical protein
MPSPGLCRVREGL